jgi:type II secretory pathway component PulJ
MHLTAPRRPSRRQSRGLSLVELMVGVAVSLFVVAAAAMLVSTQLTDNRRLLLETQLQQDLRATADIITRELRRSGYWQSAESQVPAQSNSAISPNGYLALAVDSAASAAVIYRYRRLSGSESFGFKLQDGVIKACQGETALNTIDTVREGGRARTANGAAMTLPCPSLCADGTTDCWPRVGVRELTVTIAGTSRTDDAVSRTLTTSVRVRNDAVALSSEAPSNRSCPIS